MHIVTGVFRFSATADLAFGHGAFPLSLFTLSVCSLRARNGSGGLWRFERDGSVRAVARSPTLHGPHGQAIGASAGRRSRAGRDRSLRGNANVIAEDPQALARQRGAKCGSGMRYISIMC